MRSRLGREMGDSNITFGYSSVFVQVLKSDNLEITSCFHFIAVFLSVNYLMLVLLNDLVCKIEKVPTSLSHYHIRQSLGLVWFQQYKL